MEGLNHLVADALNNSHAGLGLLLEAADVEWHVSVLGFHLCQQSTGRLHLEHVVLLGLLVNGDLGVLLASLQRIRIMLAIMLWLR